MADLILGLKYQPVYETVKTEQELLNVFSDLRENYNKYTSQFKVSIPNGRPVESFKEFLEVAVKEQQSVVLTGSGDIGGLVVKDASLEYNLSKVSELVKHWDIYRDGSCHSCHNHYYIQIAQDHSEHACDVVKPMDWSHHCPKYDAYKKNSEGKPARTLAELIEEASK